jgi:hypothetical protein
VKIQHFIIVSLVALGLGGCYWSPGPVPTPATVITTATATPASTSIHVGITPTFSATLTDTEAPPTTSSPSPTPTQGIPLPLASQTPISLPTPTPLPPLSIDTAKQILEPFVQGNGGCQLPCVMGLTPGTSDYEAFAAMLQYFHRNHHDTNDYNNGVDIGSDVGDRRGGASLSFWQKSMMVQVILGYELAGDKVNRADFSTGVYQYIVKGDQRAMRAVYEDPYYTELVSAFFLPHILNTFGRPSQILIRPFPNDPEFPATAQYAFDFVLFYPEKGFLLEYIAVRQEQGTDFVGCPTKAHIEGSAWDPTAPLTLAQAVEHLSNLNGIGASNMDTARSIDEVTSFTIDEFVATFSDPKAKVCVHTSKRLWLTMP